MLTGSLGKVSSTLNRLLHRTATEMRNNKPAMKLSPTPVVSTTGTLLALT